MKDNWLSRRIKEAREEIKRWPQWMRDTAKMEGKQRD